MADTEQTFDSVQDWVAHRSEERAQAAQKTDGMDDGAEDGDIEDIAASEPEEEIMEADPAFEDADDDLDAGSEDGDVEEVQESEPETAVAAPQYLGKEEKELFEKLTPQAKKLFVEADARREAFVTRKSQELSQVRQAFEQRMEGLDGFISETEAQLAEYQQVDWQQAANELDPRDYQAHRARFEALQQQHQEASTRRGEAEQVQLREYTREQAGMLAQIAQADPTAKALIDPAEGPKRLGELKTYLKGQGIDDATLMWVSAPAVVLGYKAMKYDEAQKRAQSKPLPQKTPAGKVVKPASSAQGQTSTSARLKQLQGKSDLSAGEFKELMRLKRNRKG